MSALKKQIQNVDGINPTIFDMALEHVIETTGKLLTLVCDEYIAKLRKDNSVSQAMNETADRIRHDLRELLSTYKSSSFGDDVIRRIQQTNWFAANVVSPGELKKFLSDEYIWDFQDKMKMILERHIAGRGAINPNEARIISGITRTASFFLGEQDTVESHIQRVTSAIANFYGKNLSDKEMDKLKLQVKNACVISDGAITDGKISDAWKKTLNNAVDDFLKFFSDGSAYAVVIPEIKDFEGEEWANKPIILAIETAEKAHTAAKALRRYEDDRQ